MKKSLAVAAALALLISLASLGMASAEPSAISPSAAVTWTSGVQVQNLDEIDSASVTLTFYNQDGTPAASQSYRIARSSSRTFFPLTDAPSGFNGSLVISSTTQVRAVSNMMGSGVGSYLASYNGLQSGATSVNLPLIMCNNSGFNTYFNVQNAQSAGDADAHITISYKPGSNGTAGSETATIKAGASKTFDQAEGSSTKNCSTLKDGSGKFIGSAMITSDQPIVAVVMQLNTTNFPAALAYSGFSAGSPTIALPLVMANNSGYYTGIQVQNVGSSTTTVTIDYSPNTVGSRNPADEVFQLAPGASKTVIQNGAPPSNGSTVNNWATIGRYVGGATIRNTGGQNLVAIVNQTLPSPAKGSAYEGFDPAAATAKISVPLVMANNSTYQTGIQVQNVGSVAAQVTIHYGTNTAGTFSPQDEVFTLQPGASKTIIQNGAPPSNGSTVNNWGTNRYIGSATVTANASKIVAIVNQWSSSVAGDQLATSDAFNY